MKRSKKAKKIRLLGAFLAIVLILLSIPSGTKAGPLPGHDKTSHNLEVLKGPVVAIRIASAINPASLELLQRGLRVAVRENACLFLILLDTPGGLVTTVRKMIQVVMSSPVPVCVFVYPQGARAASAGALLTISADIAAMAPGTNIGAAHPVTMGGGMDENSTMSKKMENDLAAFAVSIAQKRGRNAKWAEEAVRKSISTPAKEALRLHVIDIMAKNPAELIERLRKRTIKSASGSQLVIEPMGKAPVFVKKNLRERVLEVIADPNIAYILLMIGMVGLYFELAHPGVILPGTVGALSLLLALYALHTLSASTTAILLILLAFVLFVLELFITSHGILAISGVAALILGSIMLFDSNSSLSISGSVLWSTLVTVILFFLTVAFLAAKAAMSRPKTGKDALLGQRAVIKERLSESRYMVFVHGELWEAIGPSGLSKGQEVVIDSVEGLRLSVKPKKEEQTCRLH